MGPYFAEAAVQVRMNELRGAADRWRAGHPREGGKRRRGRWTGLLSLLAG
jgi:hypothetical protein